MHRMTVLGKSGRIVLPAKFRKTLGLREGTGVIISIIGDHIEISPVDASIKRAQTQVAKYLKPGDDLVELLFDQRKEETDGE